MVESAPIDVAAHIPLVHWFVKRGGYDRRVARNANISVEDVHQAGMLGLIKAAERFDAARGFTFSTYATHWIRHYCGRLLENESQTVRVPVFLQQRRSKAGEPPRATVHSLNRPGHGKNGDDCGELIDLLQYREGEGLALDDDLPDVTLEELIAATPALTPNEARVLRLRAAGKTLEEAGAELGVCRERSRQLEAQAFGKIRAARGIAVPGAPTPTPALDVEITDAVELQIARLRAQGVGYRAVAAKVGVSTHAVQRIERSLLARIAAALESAA